MNVTNIIRGVVNATKYTVTAPIIKEDYGLYLKIEGLDLPAVYEVDFSNSENSGSSVTMVGNADGVLIPRQLIKSGQDVFAFLYWTGEEFGRTVYKFRIPNKLRPDRTEEQPTPEEQSLIDQAISALNTAVEQTAADVETTTAKAAEATSAAATATQKASEATESAQTAGTYATRAETALHGAETARTASQQSATASATSAEQAAGSALTASTKAGSAFDSATSAAQSASSAGQSALDARGYKDAANLSAESASGYAGSASDSATTATEQATIATNKALESAQSALDASTAKDEAQRIVDGIVMIEDTATGAVASIPDGADDFPMKSLVVGIDPVQDLHGQESPWPAGGGLNKVPLFESKTVNGVTLTNNNGEITLNGTATADAYFDVDVNILIPNGSTYYLCCFNPVATDSRVSLFAITDNGNPQKNMNVVNGMTTTTATADVTISKFRLRAPIGVTLTNFKCSPMLQIGGTAPTVFSPYENICPISGWTGMQLNVNGTVIPISWQTEAGTVYGGTLDVVSGELVVDRASVDMGTLTWRKNSYRLDSSSVMPTVKAPTANNIKANIVCEMYKTITADGTFLKQNGIAIARTGALFVYDPTYEEDETVTNFVTSVRGKKIVYELATPIVYHLTPTKVRTLLGQNNVWADTGNSTVEYYADTKRYIDKKIAELG